MLSQISERCVTCNKLLVDPNAKKAQRTLKFLAWKNFFAGDKTGSWLSELWTKYAYLASRSALVPSSNYFCADNVHHYTNKVETRAANFAFWTNVHMDKIEKEILEPIVGGGVIPISMHTHRDFSATRVPKPEIDELRNTIKSKYIIVFCQGEVYQFFPYNRRTGALYHPRYLQKEFRKLIDYHNQKVMANRQNKNLKNYGLAVLTSSKRTDWANLRSKIIKTLPSGAKTIKTIENARFAISFDQNIAVSDKNEHKLAAFGDIGNIWYDKSITFVISRNARVAHNCEHTTGEATNFGVFASLTQSEEGIDVNGDCMIRPETGYEKLKEAKVKIVDYNKDSQNLHHSPGFKYLSTDEIRLSLQEELHQAHQNLSKIADNFDNDLFLIDIYGKEWIKKQRISPDNFMQVCLQRCYYRLRGKIPKVYESGAIIMYRGSRTETIRTVNQHSVAYCQNPSIENMRNACKEIAKYKVDLSCGQAADRHLFGLYVIGRYLKVKFDIFENFEEIWKMDNLSSSNTPFPIENHMPYDRYARCGAFGPQIEDGFGVSYFWPFRWVMVAAITCFKDTNKEGVERFGNELWDTLIEARKLFEPDFEIPFRHKDMCIENMYACRNGIELSDEKF